MHFRTYNWILLIPLGALGALFLAVGLWVEPIEGDLTRVGGFTENNFGWNQPQQKFDTILYTLETGREYDRYYDVVVLGDSFSLASPKTQWQNYLVRATGLSLATYRVNPIDLEAFVASPAFRDHPPRVVIYQTVERAFVDRGRAWNQGPCEADPVPDFDWKPTSLNPIDQPTSPYTRDRRNGLLHPNLPSGVQYLKRLIKKTISHKSRRAVRIPLTRTDLFSNRQSGHLLVYRKDFERYGVTEQALQEAICGLTFIQNVFQKNGRTFFVGMIAPDKLTAYRNVLKDFDRPGMNWFETLARQTQLNVPRLDRALQREIERGMRDVYLPNNSHWGSTGHKIVADTLIRYLTEQNILAPSS